MCALEDVIDVMEMNPSTRADFVLMSNAIGARLCDYKVGHRGRMNTYLDMY